MTETSVIEIAKDFTIYPGGRKSKDGPGSGEEFRRRFLLPNIEQGRKITVVLAGVYGYPVSFLEEAFGGLVRLGHSSAKLHDLIEIEAGDESFEPYVHTIWALIDEQAATDRSASAT